MPAIPSWLLEPLWDQFAALLPPRPRYAPSHPLGCHRPRIDDRIIFEKLVQVLRFGCSYASIADCTCGATTIRDRRDEWIKAGIFGKLKQIARESYDRIVGLVLEEIAIDYRDKFLALGGERLTLVPALNDDDRHAQVLAAIVRNQLQGWTTGETP